MTTLIAKSIGAGESSLPRRAPNVLTRLALKKSGRSLRAVSVHVPVTPENRSRLRAMRQAELAAWNATTEVGFDTGHFERMEATEKERRDLRAFGLIAALALATVSISLLKSPAFVEQWTGIVNFLRQLVG
jgi:hypothetical protein